MKKIILISTVFTVVLIILFAFVWFYSHKLIIPDYLFPAGQEADKPKGDGLIKIEEELRLQEQVAEIVSAENFEGCNNVENKLYKTVCINNIALSLAQKTQDISYCQKIDNELIPQSDCIRQIIFQKSLDEENIGVCAETAIEELRKQCEDGFYLQLALKKDNTEICGREGGQEKIDACYNNFLIRKSFMSDIENFNCSLLRGEDAQADCKQLKENQGQLSGMIIPGMGLCEGLKTNLFSSFCLIIAPL